MKSSYHSKKEAIIRLVVWGAAELFAIGCLIYSFWIKDTYQVIACVFIIDRGKHPLIKKLEMVTV